MCIRDSSSTLACSAATIHIAAHDDPALAPVNVGEDDNPPTVNDDAWIALANLDNICNLNPWLSLINFINWFSFNLQLFLATIARYSIALHSDWTVLHQHNNWQQLESHSSVTNSIFYTMSCPSSSHYLVLAGMGWSHSQPKEKEPEEGVPPVPPPHSVQTVGWAIAPATFRLLVEP